MTAAPVPWVASGASDRGHAPACSPTVDSGHISLNSEYISCEARAPRTDIKYTLPNYDRPRIPAHSLAVDFIKFGERR